MMRQRGNALVLVIVAIAALVAIAAPFALSMRLHERSARGFAAGVKAEEAARGVRELAVRRLLDGTPTEERRAAEAAGDLDGSGEDVDSLDELTPTPTAVPGYAAWRLVDPKAVEVAVEVEDEQGKANLNSASEVLLGNLLGVAELSLDIEAEAKEIQLDGDAPFFSDANRETYDGILWIDSELIVYKHVERTLVGGAERSIVSGLERGAFFSTPDPRQLVHRKGALVRDARGWKLAQHPYWVEMGGYRPYARVSGMREIASWQLVDLTLANLFRRGVTAETLASYGLGGEVLRSMGAGRSFDRQAHPPEPKPAAAKKDAAARPEGATPTAEGEEGGAPAKAGPPDPDAEAEKLAKKLEKGNGDPGAEGAATVDEALRRMGRKDGSAWLSKVLGAVGGSGSTQSKAFVEQARARMKQLEDHERTYYRGQAEQAARLADARDLEALSARELEKIRPFVCAASARAGEWAGGALVVNSVEYDPDASGTTLVLGVEVPEAAAGLPCRVDTPDRGPVYRRIVQYRRGNDRRAPQLAFFPQLEGDYEAGALRVFVAPPHPVNVNTAPRRLLEALLTGLRANPGQMSQVAGGTVDYVTPAEARAVAARLVEAPLTEEEDLVKVLDAAASASEISMSDRLAILLNALDPGNPALLSRTLPFCWKGGEVASIRSTGIVNDQAGNEVAKKTFREVVSVGPPRGSVVHMDSQADFFAGFTDEWLRAGQSLRAGRRANLVESFPVSLRPTNVLRGPLWWPSRSHAVGQGELRLASSELAGDDTWSKSPVVRHFREDAEGKKIEAGKALAESSAPVLVNLQPFGAVMAPGHFEMWFKPTWSDGYRVFFDTGAEASDDRNRVACWYDPDSREVVVEASDTAFDQEEPKYIGRGPRRAELRAPVRFEAGRWYHIAACWRGTRQNDLALFVDGKSVGRESHWTRLASDLGPTDVRAVVEDGAIFPIRGVVRIGSELIDYDNAGGAWRDGPLGGTVLNLAQTAQIDQTTGQPLTDPNTGQPLMQRTSRTGRKAHKRGTPVQVGGYTDPLGLRAGDPRAGIPPIQGRIPGGNLATAEVLPSPTPKARVYPQQDQRLVNGDLGIVAGDTVIPVVGANEPFPLQNGVIQIGMERILYAQAVMVAGQVDQFTGCQRGYDGTTAAEHLALENVLLCDVRVTPGNQSFDQNNPILQLTVPGTNVDPQPEWLAVRKPSDGSTDKFYLDHGDTGGGVHVPPGFPWPTKPQYRATPAFTQWLPEERSNARAQHGTTGRTHQAGENAIGAFFTQWAFAGHLDWCTVVELNDPSTREEHRIAWGDGHWAAFIDFTRKTFQFPQARLVKRPSGELPTYTSNELSIGGKRSIGGGGGTCEGRIDEPRLVRDEEPWARGQRWNNFAAYTTQVVMGVSPRWLGSEIPASGQAQVGIQIETRSVVTPQGRTVLPPQAGTIATSVGSAGSRAGLLVKIDDEVLGAGRSDGNTITFTERGMLSSVPAAHGDEATPYVLPFPPIARLSGGFAGDKGSQIAVTGERLTTLIGDGPGYIGLDRDDGNGIGELLPYDRFQQGRFTRPLDEHRAGAYRGAFGSERDTPLSDGKIAVIHPFRYFDRFDPAIESDDATYWQATVAPACAASGACLFETIEWDEERPTTELGAVIYARVDGKPEWTANPSNAPGGIFRFDDPKKEARIDVAGRMLEVRVVFPFKPGAFVRNAWKDTDKIGAVRVSYIEGIRTIEAEDLLR